MAVALAAFAMHATLASHDRERLALASVFAFGQGLALAALAPASTSRWRGAGLWIVLAGTVLFCGALALAASAGIEPVTAPAGGGLLIVGWLIVAVGYLVE